MTATRASLQPAMQELALRGEYRKYVRRSTPFLCMDILQSKRLEEILGRTGEEIKKIELHY